MRKYGINCVFKNIPFNPYKYRLRLSIYNLIRYISIRKKIDAIYGVTFKGIEFIIFLHALGVIRKPVIVWHHTAVVIPRNPIRKKVSNFFYKGFDKLFFFSEKLRTDSLKTGKVNKNQTTVIHWGADLNFYDSLLKDRKTEDSFVSTGRENRDFPTLIKAFDRLPYKCDIYTSRHIGNNNYKKILEKAGILNIPNVRVHFVNSSAKRMAEIVNNAYGVVICCLDYPYTVGLTTLVEALALGLPVITTDNPAYPIDVEKENVGIKAPYGDIDAWVHAIKTLQESPEKRRLFGENGRTLAEKRYNLEIYAREIASELLSFCKPNK
jgi:glycosyltransferase involved in cell wall biosynthesis